MPKNKFRFQSTPVEKQGKVNKRECENGLRISSRLFLQEITVCRLNCEKIMLVLSSFFDELGNLFGYEFF